MTGLTIVVGVCTIIHCVISSINGLVKLYDRFHGHNK